MSEKGSLPEWQEEGWVNDIENKNHHHMEEQVEDAALFSSIQSHTRRRRRRLIAVFSLFLFLVLIPLILILDLTCPAANRRRFEVNRVALDASEAVPAATVDVAFEHGSRLSSVEPQAVRCSVEGGGNVNVLVEEDQEYQQNDDDDDDNGLHYYRLHITCPEQDVKSHANLMWKAATRQDNDFSNDKVVCWVDVLVHVAGFLPVSKTVKVDGGTLAQGWNSSPSMEESEQQQEQQPPFLHVRNARVDELEVAVRVDVPAWVRSAARTVQITLPPVTVNGRLEGHGDDLGTVFWTEGLNATYVRGDNVDGGMDSGNVAVVGVSSSSSSSSGGLWFSPLLDILTSTRDHSAIDVTMNGNGTFLETLLGRQHRVTVDFEHETQSPPPNRRRRHRDLRVDNDDEHNSKAVVTTNRQMQDLDKDQVKMDCVKVVDDSDNLEFSICWLLRLQTGFVFWGDMSVYDLDMSAVVKTDWTSPAEGQLEVDTLALVDVTEGDGTTTGLMDVDGTITMGMIDDSQLFFQSKYVNDGTWKPFQAVLNMEGVVSETGELTMDMSEASFLLEGKQLADAVGSMDADPNLMTYQVSMSDPVLEMEYTFFGQTSIESTETMSTSTTTTMWDANTTYKVFGEVVWDTKMEGKTVTETDGSGAQTTTFYSSMVDEPNDMLYLVENKMVTGDGNIMGSQNVTFTLGGVDQMKSEQMYVMEFGDEGKGKFSMIAKDDVWDYESSGSGSYDIQETGTIILDDLFYRQGQYVYYNVDGLLTFAVNDTTYTLTMQVNGTEHDWSLEGDAILVDNTAVAVGPKSLSLVLQSLTLQVKQELQADVSGQFEWSGMLIEQGGVSDDSWNITMLFNDTVQDGYLSGRFLLKDISGDSFNNVTADLKYVTFGLNQVSYVDVNGIYAFSVDEGVSLLIQSNPSAKLLLGASVNNDNSGVATPFVWQDVALGWSDDTFFDLSGKYNIDWDEGWSIYNVTLESDPTAMIQLSASTVYSDHYDYDFLGRYIEGILVEWQDTGFGWKGDSLFNTGGRFSLIPSESVHFTVDESEWLDFVSDTKVSWYDDQVQNMEMFGVKWERGLFQIGSEVFLDSGGSIELRFPDDSGDVSGTIKSSSSMLAAMQMGMGMDFKWIEDEMALSILVQQMRIGWNDVTYLNSGAFKDNDGGGGLPGTSPNGGDTTPDDTEGEDGDNATTTRSTGGTSGGSSWGLSTIAMIAAAVAAMLTLL